LPWLPSLNNDPQRGLTQARDGQTTKKERHLMIMLFGFYHQITT
jgi:hypothetical protein